MAWRHFSKCVDLAHWVGCVRRHDKSCVAGFEKRYHGIVSAFMFATETQQTIGKFCLSFKSLLYCAKSLDLGQECCPCWPEYTASTLAKSIGGLRPTGESY